MAGTAKIRLVRGNTGGHQGIMLAMVVMAASQFNHVNVFSLFVAYQVRGFVGRWKIDYCIRLCLLVHS